MRLLDVRAVLDREEDAQGVDPEIKVLKELDDKSTSYAIVSHRWGTEVSYDEMTRLAAMDERRRNKVRERDGYQKIIRSCEQAMKDGYRWLWIDTCCIDKRSSAELSEAINSMYRWYRNSQMCYVYLNDVSESALPTQQDFSRFGKSSGWPEWFSRGWTLQELIAPKEAEFFNNRWMSIGSKQSLISTLVIITRIPEKVLSDEKALRSTDSSERPGVAQVMSWAADRRTTRVEDRAYSLLGLFNVNMPMLYGEGSKAFQRLQLEIIRVSSDHSIFAWNTKGQLGVWGSILANDPSYFQGCHDIKNMDPKEFFYGVKEYMRWNGIDMDANQFKLESLRRSFHSPQFSVFNVTNVGIQVWLPVIRDRDTPTIVFKAILPCRDRYKNLITIDLEFRGLSSYKWFRPGWIPDTYPEFRSLYLDCSQDAEESHHNLTLDDRGASYYGFTRCGTFPREITSDTLTLSQGNNLMVLVYANDSARFRFAVGFGYYLGEVWAHVICDKCPANREVWSSWADFAQRTYDILLPTFLNLFGMQELSLATMTVATPT
ncbi:heterokaryon incompatibility protein-domain-containing protein [Pisolithus marmoratus]|nr:heterokaryon incompatibility protein-domain-containing protein [Pisolithus marmoratus]